MNEQRVPDQPAGLARRVVVAVPDLFFLLRIRAVAEQIGVAIEECAPSVLPARCAAAPPRLVVLDLHAPGDPLAAVRMLKTDARSAGIPIVGFYSHVDGALRARAVAAGVSHVLPRSAFTRKLPALLAGTT